LDHASFNDYCRERWGFSDGRARQLIAAAKTVKTVTNVTVPNEGAARELGKIPAEKRQTVVDWAQEKTGDKPLTAKTIREAAADVMEAETGEDDEVAELEVVVQDRPHVAQNSGNNEWYTPREYIEAACSVMGGIDCDPASSQTANRTVGATMFYTAEQDGLVQTWGKRVWLNPPYAQPLVADFTRTLLVKIASGEVEQACVLVNNATETAWFQAMLRGTTAVCFPCGRIRFLDLSGQPANAPLQGQAILYFGNRGADFRQVFGVFGCVVVPENTAAKAAADDNIRLEHGGPET
jgi:hypothetical protein